MVAAAIGSAAWWPLRSRGPDPPELSDLPALDPDAAALIRERIDAVSAARGSAEAWGALGIACEANGITGQAAQAYETATEIAPQHARWWYRLALVRSRLGDDSAALAALDRTIAIDGGYAPAHWRRGLWLFDRGDLSAAEASFRRAIDSDPADPGGSVGLARVHLARGESQRAVETLESLLDAHPGDRYALQLLGTAYRRLNREDDAHFALALGASGEPQWRDPWSDDVATARRGYAAGLKDATRHLMTGQPAQAIPILERLRSQKPDDLALATHLASAYAAAGRAGEAIPLLEAVLVKDPDHFDAHLSLATAYHFAKASDRAAVHVERAVALRPQSAKAHFTRGMMLWQTGHAAEAAAVLAHAVALDPRDPSARVWTGLIFLERGEPTVALRYFDEALRIDPLNVEAFAGLGVAHLRLGAADDARAALHRAAQIDPNHPRVLAAQQLLQQFDGRSRRSHEPRR